MSTHLWSSSYEKRWRLSRRFEPGWPSSSVSETETEDTSLKRVPDVRTHRLSDFSQFLHLSLPSSNTPIGALLSAKSPTCMYTQMGTKLTFTVPFSATDTVIFPVQVRLRNGGWSRR